MVSPCIDVLRKLSSQMNATLGARLGTKHKSPSLDKDLVALQNSMQEHGVFKIENGRVLRDMKDPVVPNVITLGLNQLYTPLQEYNRAFSQLQQRRREDPLQDETSPPSSPEVQSTASELSTEMPTSTLPSNSDAAPSAKGPAPMPSASIDPMMVSPAGYQLLNTSSYIAGR